MNRALGLLFAVTAASGCGDNFGVPAVTPDELLAKLQALPGVTVREQPTEQTDYHYYVLQFTQLIDHDDPSQGTFQQEVSLLHRSDLPNVPMVVHTSGYSDTTRDQIVELTQLLDANQVSIEHRYFGDSRPKPPDWTKLTIAQAAADEHEIITALHSIYAGAFLTTGGSKGGMTAVFHRRFYPTDVDGTVAYVAPISFGAPDSRYALYLEKIGPVDCRQAVRDVAVELLSRRRPAMFEYAGLQDHTYTRVALGPAVEAAIVGLEWTFWQYHGVALCPMVPPLTSDDNQLFAFLDRVSPVSASDDTKIAFFEAYYYQSYAQLGYPDGGTDYLVPYMHYTEEDYAKELPTTVEPTYDAASMRDIDDFVEHRGDRLLFVYGQWDPWTGGKFAKGNATDSSVLIQPKGGHNARIADLELSDREEAFAKLRNWTGVTPQTARLRRAGKVLVDPEPPRLPPALVHALTAPK